MDSSLYKQIMDYLLEIINRNAGVPNFKLPSERMLAATFDTSRKPVRNAYEALIERGYVINIHGRGYFIRSDIVRDDLLSAFHKDIKISFVIPSILTRYSHSIISGVADFCTENNIEYSIHLSDNSQEKESALLRSLPRSGSMGTILFPTDYDRLYHDELIRYNVRKYPFVLVDRLLPNLQASFIASDSHQAMVDATKFLHDRGYQNPLFIVHSPTLASSVDARINGYTHGLFRYYKVASPQNLLNLPVAKSEYKAAIMRHLKKYPSTDVLIIHGPERIPVLEALDALGIPDMQLMIFDNELSVLESSKLKPYFIQQDGYHIGYISARTLYNHILGDTRPVLELLPVTITDCEGNCLSRSESVSRPLTEQR